MTIKILPDNVINKIAAGEVVERPASVVRELVENSIDAGATEITVHVEQGGQSLLRVIDNGSGMERADALLALERHATSKIVDSDDLFSIATLGFRGEALPSIAAVSRMKLATRSRTQEVGTEIVINGGAIGAVTPCSIPAGTQIEVRALFYNVPARRKFLRSARYEELRIKEWLTATALSKPAIRFRLIADQRELLNLAPRNSIIERGREIIRGDTIPLEVALGEGERRVELYGVVSHPSQARADGGGFHFLVNGRVVHDRMLLRAVREGFLTTLKDREYPVGFLSLKVHPAQVDVNVHPQKSEVRFSDGRALFVLVKDSVARAVREFRAPLLGESSYEPPTPREPLRYQPLRSGGGSEVAVRWGGSAAPVLEQPEPAAAADVLPMVQSLPLLHARPAPSLHRYAQRSFRFSELRYLAQALDCFLLCQRGEELVVVDMHAAHERVNFNYIREGILAKSVTSQVVLLPETVELSELDLLRVVEERALLERCGIQFDTVEGGIALRAVPAGLKVDAPSLIKELVASLSEARGEGVVEERIDKIAARLACHASIRSGEQLTREEVYELFAALDQAELSGACPHGRPVVVQFSRMQVETWFGRDR